MANENDSTNGLNDLTDDLENRLCWARATVGLVVSDEQTEAAISNAAGAADAHLQDAQELLARIRGLQDREKRGNTAVQASDAFAILDKIHDEREALNQNIDFGSDAAFHRENGTVSGKTAEELSAALTAWGG